LQEIEAKLDASVKTAGASLDKLAKRKTHILSIQSGSQVGALRSRKVTLKEGSLRAIWTERAKTSEEARKVIQLLLMYAVSVQNARSLEVVNVM
jgi:hypothetical protein